MKYTSYHTQGNQLLRMVQKLPFLVSLFVVMIFTNTQAQISAHLTIKILTNDATYVIDSSNNRSALKGLKAGDFFRINVENINTYVYSVNVNTKDSIYESKVALPQLIDISFESLASILNLGPVSAPSQDDISINELQFNNIRNQLNQDSTCENYILGQEAIINDQYIPTFQSLTSELIWSITNIEIDGIVNLQSMQRLIGDLKYFRKEIVEAKEAFENSNWSLKCRDYKLMMENYGLILSKYTEFLKATDTLALKNYLILANLNLNSYYSVKVNEIVKNIINSYSTINEINLNVLQRVFNASIIDTIRRVKLDVDYSFFDSLNNVRKSVMNNANRKNEYFAKYHQEIVKLKSVAHIASLNLPLNDNIYGSFTAIDSSNAKLLEAISEPNVRSKAMELVNIENNSSSSYTSLPIQYLGDNKEIFIDIVPRDSSMRLTRYSTTITIPLNTVNYFAIGSSYFIAGNRNKSYFLTQQEQSGRYLISRENNTSNMDWGFYLHANFMLHLSNSVSAGISIGPGVSLSDKVRPRLLTGFQMGIGNRNKLAIGVGGIFGEVDELSSKYHTSVSYLEQPTNILVKRLRCSLYGSLGVIHLF